MDSPGRDADTDAAEDFWDRHHRALPHRPEERPNPVLVEVVERLHPGVALDIGCGAGGDTLWLARRGWRVTAVDIASIAVHRLAERAHADGVADQVTAERHDLTRTFPSGRFDLVSAQYFHTPFAGARTGVLRNAAHALRPGGVLLIVDHGSTAPWSWNQDPEARFPAPAEVAAELELDPTHWSILRADASPRRAVGPSGETATVIDHVLAIGRSAS